MVLEHKRKASQPVATPEAPLKHRYTLRGVSTFPHVTYVLHPRDPSTPSSSSSTDSEPEWQWWRMSISVEDGKLQRDQAAQAALAGSATVDPTKLGRTAQDDLVGYTVRKVSEEDVLLAARQESKSVLLVYASETAVNYPVKPLPPGLRVSPMCSFIKSAIEFFRRNSSTRTIWPSRTSYIKAERSSRPTTAPTPIPAPSATTTPPTARQSRSSTWISDLISRPQSQLLAVAAAGSQGAVTGRRRRSGRRRPREKVAVRIL